jgi:undecaprenyl-diphosphatase
MSQAVPTIERSSLPPCSEPRPTFVAASGVVFAVASIALFAWLAAQVLSGHTMGFDLYVRAWVHHDIPVALLPLMAGLSIVGSAADLGALSLVLVLWFWRLQWRGGSATLAASMFGAVVLDLSLKQVFHRARPLAFFGSEPHSYSFPSGHALASFCFFLVVAAVVAPRITRRLLRVALWVAAICLVAAIGLSRVWLGVHYPTDVLGGYVAASVWVSVVWASGIVRLPQLNLPRPRA